MSKREKESWRFDAEVHVWEVASEMPTCSLRSFWLELSRFAAEQVAVSAESSAAAFMAWMREQEQWGSFSNAQISQHYAAFCAANTHSSYAAEDRMRHALASFPGVQRVQRDTLKDGRRYRPYVWLIEKPST